MIEENTPRYAFHLGTCLVSWEFGKQPIVTLSLDKSKYVAATSTTCHTMWLRRLLIDLAHEEKEPSPIFCDNNSTIVLSRNHMFHCKSQHIDTQFHFIRELVSNGDITLHFCKSQNQFEDIFTKPLTLNTFQFQRQRLGVVDVVVYNDQI